MQLDPVVSASIPSTGPLASYMRWAIKTTDAEHLFHLGAVLPCLSDFATSMGFVIDPERLLRPVLWTFLVGVSASSKTTAMKRAQTHYQRVRSTMLNGQEVRPFIFAEGSIPGLFEALAARFDPESGLSTGIVDRDEAARLLESRDATVADMLCQIIDGEEVERHLRSLKAERRAGGTVHDRLIQPAFSGRLATTFARIREVTQASYLEGGLYSRMMWFVGSEFHPHPRLEINTHRQEADRVLGEWVDWGRWMLVSQLGPAEERVVGVSEAAVDWLRETLFDDFVRASRTDSRLNATRKRALTQAVIVAGLYALSQQRLRIELDDMERAVNLCTFCLECLSGLEGSLAVSEQVSAAEKVYTVIQQAGPNGARKSELYRTRLDKREIDAAVEHLIDAGRVEQVTERAAGAGRPATRLRVPGGEDASGGAKVIPIRVASSRTVLAPPCGTCGGTGAEPGTDGATPCPVCWDAPKARRH